MSARSDLDALLADPTRADGMPPDTIRTLLAEVATTHMRLAALEHVLLSRLIADLPSNGEDHLLRIEEAAARLAVEKDWLRRHRALPFVVPVSEGQVRYSAKGIERYIATRSRAQR